MGLENKKTLKFIPMFYNPDLTGQFDDYNNDDYTTVVKTCLELVVIFFLLLTSKHLKITMTHTMKLRVFISQ